MRNSLIILPIIVFTILVCSFINNSTYKIALLKYNGGGDWYSNPTSLGNLIKYCNSTIATNINNTPDQVDVGSEEIFNYPFLHMTGHGNVIFSPDEISNLKTYLKNGGFLHIDVNYGMDQFIRREIKKMFPNQKLLELPFSHPIFHQKFNFPKGLPKVHEHDNKPPQAFGIFEDNKLVILYTYECDLGDGWEDTEVHNLDNETHLKALQMGSNIVQFAFKLGDSHD